MGKEKIEIKEIIGEIIMKFIQNILLSNWWVRQNLNKVNVFHIEDLISDGPDNRTGNPEYANYVTKKGFIGF